MLNVGKMEEGIVLDHIKAGYSMSIYNYLNLDKMGRKDIIKIQGGLDLVDLDVLGYIDHNITINIIKGGEVVEKKTLSLPKKITNVIRCRNPRCITSLERGLDHVFVLTDPEKETYRCLYCEEKYDRR